MPKVFLSYNRKDEAFVAEFYRRLKRDGVECFFDKESIGWGENWVRALEQGIDECEIFVPVLSPEFCDSEWITIERTSAMIEDPSGVRRRVRPLLLRECPNRPRFLKPIQHIDVSTTELFEQNYPKICAALGGALTPDTEPQRGTLPPVRALPAKHRMPHRSLTDRFVGRVEDLWKLHDLLFQSEVAIVQGVGVVAGTGGLGKTQLAIEYVRRFGYKYGGGVYWVDADQGLGTLIAQVSEAAGVEVDGRAPQEKQLEQLWHGLHSPLLSLVVLDNFPEELPEEAPRLESYLPTSGQVQTLVTTRRKDLDRHPGLNLDCLSPGEGLALLNSGARQFGAEAEGLLSLLGGLPLPIELTRGYLNRRKDATPAVLVEEMDLGELEEARDLLRQAHQAFLEKLGAEHRHTKTVLNHLRGVEGQAAGEG